MIDIRIMASEKRAENVQKLLDKLELPDAAVTWDDRPEGGDAMYTARKAWLHPMEEGITHRLILQDDIDVCENFREIVDRIVKTHPERVLSLINFLQPKNFPNYNNTPYYRVYTIPGCAILMPKEIIEPCVQWCDESTDETLKPHDDLMISKYCREHNVMMVTVLPCIVQHPDDDSLLGHRHDWKRTSKYYDEKGQADWKNRSILPVL